MALAFNADAQVKSIPALKIDTALLSKQLKAQPRVTFMGQSVYAGASVTSKPIPVVKINNPLPTPAFQFRPNVTEQYSPIHVTPLPSTTFKPALITSPGGTVSSINSEGMIIKKH